MVSTCLSGIGTLVMLQSSAVPGGGCPSGMLFSGGYLQKKRKELLCTSMHRLLGTKDMLFGSSQALKGFRNSPDKCRGSTTAMIASMVQFLFREMYPRIRSDQVRFICAGSEESPRFLPVFKCSEYNPVIAEIKPQVVFVT